MKLKLEMVTEMDLERENEERDRKERAAEKRAEITRRLNRRLVGSMGDTTGEMFDARDCDVPLFRRSPCR